jgi:hypothetical protein
VLSLFVLAAIGYVAGRRRALNSAGGNTRALHSLPVYYGLNVALTSLVPALGVLVIWLMAQPMIVESRVSGMIPDEAIPQESTRDLLMSDVRRVADGLDIAVQQGVLTRLEARALDAEETDIRAQLGDLAPTRAALCPKAAEVCEPHHWCVQIPPSGKQERSNGERLFGTRMLPRSEWTERRNYQPRLERLLASITGQETNQVTQEKVHAKQYQEVYP